MDRFDTMVRASIILNRIRQDAQAKNGNVVIMPNSAEWDAIFFAEEFMRGFASKIEQLAVVARRI